MIYFARNIHLAIALAIGLLGLHLTLALALALLGLGLPGLLGLLGTSPRLITNPSWPTNRSHQHNLLLIYCHCRYFLILPLLTYCRPRYIFFAQDGGRKGGVSEPEVIQKWQFIPTMTHRAVVCTWSRSTTSRHERCNRC